MSLYREMAPRSRTMGLTGSSLDISYLDRPPDLTRAASTGGISGISKLVSHNGRVLLGGGGGHRMLRFPLHLFLIDELDYLILSLQIITLSVFALVANLLTFLPN